MRRTTFTLVAIDCGQDVREVARLAPSRILPVAPGPGVEPTAGRVLERLRTLPMGPPIPAAEKLVEQARRRVPGQP